MVSTQVGEPLAQEVSVLELNILIYQQQELKGTKVCGVLNARLRSSNLFKKGIKSWDWFLSQTLLAHSGKVEG